MGRGESGVFATAGCTVVDRAGRQATGSINSSSDGRVGRQMGLMMLYSCSQVGDEVEQLERVRPDSAEVYWQKSGGGGLPD